MSVVIDCADGCMHDMWHGHIRQRVIRRTHRDTEISSFARLSFLSPAEFIGFLVADSVSARVKRTAWPGHLPPETVPRRAARLLAAPRHFQAACAALPARSADCQVRRGRPLDGPQRRSPGPPLPAYRGPGPMPEHCRALIASCQRRGPSYSRSSGGPASDLCRRPP